MKLGVPGEVPGRGWGTRENDESGNEGGLRRRPGRPGVSLMRSQQTGLGMSELKDPALLHPDARHTSN